MREQGYTLLNELLSEIKNSDDLNVVYRGLKAHSAYLSARTKAFLAIGDMVTFTAKDGRKITGKVQKIMPKNVQVLQADANVRWKVTPSLLQKAA
jgi:hypothetical protein